MDTPFAPALNSSTIADATKACQGEFRRASKSLRESSATVAANRLANQYDRLALWSQDVGAVDGTLDLLLQQSSSLRSCTVKLLQELLQELTNTSLSIDSWIEEIQDIVDNLFNLEPALQNPAPLDKVQPELHYFNEKFANLRVDPYNNSDKGLNLVYESVNPAGNKPDLDIIAIPSVHGEVSWAWSSYGESGTGSGWLQQKLPEILQNNGIYTRIFSAHYESEVLRNFQCLNFDLLVNPLVKSINLVRIADPERPLFLIAHGFGGLLAKQLIGTLIKEGLSVDTSSKPICGCLFFNVPLQTPVQFQWLAVALDQYATQSLDASFHELKSASDKIIQNFSHLESTHLIPIVNYLNQNTDDEENAFTNSHVPAAVAEKLIPDSTTAWPHHRAVADFFPSKEETVFLLAHQIACIAEDANRDGEVASRMELPAPAGDYRNAPMYREDPFAMLVAYNTAIMINDSQYVIGETWSSMKDLVRDLVDVVTNYDTEDVDLQLFNQEIQSYSVRDGVQAAKLLSGMNPKGSEWACAHQVKRYLQKYSTAPSSLKADGLTRPVNMIILTGGSSGQTGNGNQLLDNLRDIFSQFSGLNLPLIHIQFVDISKGPSKPNYLQSDVEKRRAIKNKILAIGRLSRVFQVLREESERIEGLETSPDDPPPASPILGPILMNTKDKDKIEVQENFWDEFDSASKQLPIPGCEIAPTFRVTLPYTANSLIIQRILLGAITTRFRQSRIESPSRPIADEGSLLSTESDLGGSSTADGTNLWSWKGKTTTQASSITSGDQFHIHEQQQLKQDLKFSTDWVLESPQPEPEPLEQAQVNPAMRPRASSESRRNDIQMDETRKRRNSSEGLRGPNRDYLLALADPDRPAAAPAGGKQRVQKHPATFQCTLCPKRFTRAYNLRSHLRTHTDERPFVCTVCGKAFARQHDRKRHESLHSGEKKFVCRGALPSQPSLSWGCGRRFARVDALGRHFGSRAGRLCIKPLLEDEQNKRSQSGMQETDGDDTAFRSGSFELPASILAQYPALQGLDWEAPKMMDDPREMSDVSFTDVSG